MDRWTNMERFMDKINKSGKETQFIQLNNYQKINQ